MASALPWVTVRVLLIDDVVPGTEARESLLREAGLAVVRASTIPEAESALRTAGVRVVLVSADWSGLAGFGDALRRWKRAPQLSAAPVLILAKPSSPEFPILSEVDAIVPLFATATELRRSLATALLKPAPTRKIAPMRMTPRGPLAVVRPGAADAGATNLLALDDGRFQARCTRCFRSSPVLRGAWADVERQALGLGWVHEDDGWTCPVCLERVRLARSGRFARSMPRASHERVQGKA